MDPLVPLDLRVPQVIKVLLAVKDFLVYEDLPDQLERLADLEHPESRDLRENWAKLDHVV